MANDIQIDDIPIDRANLKPQPAGNGDGAEFSRKSVTVVKPLIQKELIGRSAKVALFTRPPPDRREGLCRRPGVAQNK